MQKIGKVEEEQRFESMASPIVLKFSIFGDKCEESSTGRICFHLPHRIKSIRNNRTYYFGNSNHLTKLSYKLHGNYSNHLNLLKGYDTDEKGPLTLNVDQCNYKEDCPLAASQLDLNNLASFTQLETYLDVNVAHSHCLSSVYESKTHYVFLPAEVIYIVYNGFAELPDIFKSLEQMISFLSGQQVDSSRFLATCLTYKHLVDSKWIVINDLKTGCDFMLYRGDPESHHSEYGVKIHFVLNDEGKHANEDLRLINLIRLQKSLHFVKKELLIAKIELRES
ncbi:MAG: hypothetical protein MHMPM18_004212, partial [Marteilia pararefringens]